MTQILKYQNGINLVSDQRGLKSAIDFIFLMDEYFIPPIATKVNLNEYMDKVFSLGYILTYEFEDDIIGLSCFYANDKVKFFGYLSYFAVNKKHHGLGIGRTLIQETHQIMRQQSMVSSTVETNSSNDSAIGFYMKFGYKEKLSYIDSWGYQKLVLKKKL